MNTFGSLSRKASDSSDRDDGSDLQGRRGGRAHLVPAWVWPVVVGLVLRIVAAWVWEIRAGGQFVFGDSESYWALARAIASGEEYRYGNARIFRMPGYPLVLAPLFWLGPAEPPHLWARFLGAGFGAVAILATYLLGERLFGRSVGIWSAWICSLYPGAIALSVFILSEALFCPVMLLALLAGVLGEQNRRAIGSCCFATFAGVLHGVAILARPSWLFFPVFSGFIGLSVGPERLRRCLMVLLTLIGTCLVLAPWWLRNGCLTGRFVPATLQSGVTLYDGLHPGASGGSDLSAVNCRLGELAREFEKRFPYPGISPPGGTRTTEPAGAEGPHDFPNGSKERGEDRLFGTFRGYSQPKENPSTREDSHFEGKRRFWQFCPYVSPQVRWEIERELYLDARLRQEAVEWVLANPAEFLRLAAVKFARMWNIWPNEPLFRSLPIRLVVAGTFLPVLIFSFLGIIAHSHRGWAYLLLVLPAIYLTVIHCVFVASLRYREPAVLAMIPLAVAGASHAWTRLKQWRRANKGENQGQEIR